MKSPALYRRAAMARLRDELFSRIMAPLCAAGRSGLVPGRVVYEQRAGTRDFIAALLDPAEGFDYAVDRLAAA